MSGSEYWLPLWEGKTGSVGNLSGRSNYSAEHREALIQDARAALCLTPEDTLLDIGCAGGFMGDVLSREVSRYSGIDYSEPSILAFALHRPELDLQVASAAALQFSDGDFTKSLMGSVLLCLSKSECAEALREMRRVTTVRGFVSGNLEGDGALQREHAKACPEGCQCYAHATWFRREELCSLALDCGWRIATTVNMDDSLPHRSVMFDMILEA